MQNSSDIELPSNRKFGIFFTAIFVITSVYFYKTGTTNIAIFFIGLAVFFLIISIFKSDLLQPLNKLWMRFGFLLGIVISPIILGVIFFGLFTPIALAMRLFGRDELRVKIKDRVTHWKLKVPFKYSNGAFKNQF